MKQKTNLSFYHLSTTPIIKALPSILLKILDSNNRALILFENNETMLKASDNLWRFSTNKVIPHGTEEEEFPEDQPVYLTTNFKNPNKAEILIITSPKIEIPEEKFDKVFLMFDSSIEDDVGQARSIWQKCKERQQDYNLTYWRQNVKGIWEKATQ